MSRYFSLLFSAILPLATIDCCSQEAGSRGDYLLLCYNVENLFHPSDDSTGGDDAFTPEGIRHWSYYRYRKKITCLAKVIVAAGEGNPPEIAGLCEVESSQVLKDLVRHPILLPFNYNFLHRDGPDKRGMDVALLYREEKFRIIEWDTYRPLMELQESATRDFLHVHGVLGRTDTLDLCMVHLVSKYSGEGSSACRRIQQVGFLANLVDSIHGIRNRSLIVVTGDFNEVDGGISMEPLRNLVWQGDSIRSVRMTGNPGSYKYQGRWEVIDRYYVVGGRPEYRISGSYFVHPVLLQQDIQYGGHKPARTYTGYVYTGGLSDHLPVLLNISRPPFSNLSRR